MSKFKSLLNSPTLKAKIDDLSNQENRNQQRIHLKHLIAQTSEAYGGDTPDYLIQTTNEILAACDTRLEETIACFESIIINHCHNKYYQRREINERD